MNPKPRAYQLLRLFFTLAVPLLLTAGSIRLVMSYEFLHFAYSRPDFPPDPYGFTLDDRRQYAPAGIDYLLNGEAIDFLGSRQLPGGKCAPPQPTACPMYTAKALNHLVDVKQITTALFALAAASALIAAAALLSCRSPQSRRAIRSGLARGSTLTLAALAALATFAITAWDAFFDRFHELLFAAGTWRFPFSDTLIRLFPERFWFDAVITAGGISALAAAAILALLWQWDKRRPPA